MYTMGKTIPFISGERYSAINDCLSNLRVELSAACVLLADVSGQLITDVGVTEGLDISNLVSLLAGGFVSTREMARYLGEKEGMNLHFHEGELFDIYAANVGNDLFLILLFDRSVQTSRIGMVWLYTKRAISELVKIIASPDDMESKEIISEDFTASLKDELDNIFD